ncbi:MAG: tetrathionate reductase family octaheme c-type cytochrome [Deltaproteobacteria bacterium]|nr:MAG: tetrathionate reductase family octaheme c-type cytochrome [Deltaproteobacteria bacterium]
MRRHELATLGMMALLTVSLAPGCADSEDTKTCDPACETGFSCVDGACVEDACDPACDAGYTCHAGQCEEDEVTCDPTCDAGYTCQDGQCVEDACDPTCDTGYTCQAGQCVEDGCDPACDTGYTCQAGQCVEDGCDPACDTGYTCQAGQCVEDACDPACDTGYTCHAGQCEEDPCDPACEEGFFCSAGQCVENVCDPVCPGGYACVEATCVELECDPTCGDGEVCVEGVCLTANSHRGNAMLAGPFANGAEVTAKCTTCHQNAAAHVMATSHWKFKGPTPGMQGAETGATIGKANLINNFCITMISNEARCTQCHAGYGWKDENFDFDNAANVDCLVCHDGTGKYAKAAKTAGNAELTTPLAAVAQSVGRPTRKACGSCHFYAGGGDNVKKGDLGSWATAPTEDADVHMGRGMDCVECHKAGDHVLAGGGLHDPIIEAPLDCTDCHQGPVIHENSTTLDNHTKHVACQTCHIPAFSRQQPTKMEWYWETAGDADRVPVADANGKPDYDKLKGDFVWGKNVTPELRWWNGSFTRMVVGDAYTSEPVDLGSPLGAVDDASARIYPFKVMVGNQPADTVNKVLAVPHLFGTIAGANPYWAKFDWAPAISEGMAYAGLDYSGTFGFVATEMYLALDHEVAPKSAARQCNDCHNGGIDFTALGYDADPMNGGTVRHATE